MVKRPIPPRRPVKQTTAVVCEKSEPLLVFYSLWVAGPKPAMSGFWYFCERPGFSGELETVRVEVTRLDEARDYARQNGYPSIMVRPGGYVGDSVPSNTRADVPPSVEMGVQEDRALSRRSAMRRGGDRAVDLRDEDQKG